MFYKLQTTYLTTQNSLLEKTETQSRGHIPLADLLRPKTLGEFVGQDEIAGKDGIIRKLIEKDKFPSMIFWGPPGVGKTTLARIIANETKSVFIPISAVTSGKKELQSIVVRAKESIQALNKKTILFIDEIHRFNKAQQDFLLPFVENGTLILIGATTENPSFEVNSALLSRSRVFVLKQHDKKSLEKILERAIKYFFDNKVEIDFEKEAKEFLIAKSNGDPRTLLNAFETAVDMLD